jgi:ribosomal protein S18 acetylase RimI-like enzyme
MPNNFDPDATALLAGTFHFFANLLPYWGRIDIEREPRSFHIELSSKHIGKDAIVVDISVGDEFVSITGIIIPGSLRHQGIGKSLIRKLYEMTKGLGKRLEIFNMVDGFYSQMITRGAQPRPCESVEITDQTDLARRAHV